MDCTTMNPVEQMTESLRLLHPRGSTFEIRILNIPNGDYPKYTMSGYFRDPVCAAKPVIGYELDGKAPIYVTLNPCLPALYARCKERLETRPASTTSDAEIQRRRWLLVDFDPTRPAGTSSTDAQLQLAHETCETVCT